MADEIVFRYNEIETVRVPKLNRLAQQAASVTSGATSWIPLVTGDEPPVLVSDGAGHLILVAWTP